MGRSWCADLPRVTLARREEPTHVTLIVPYYECPRFFARQLTHWALLPAAIREQLEVIIVDDGSPSSPAEAVLAGTQMPCVLRLFRIESDVRWNWLAARNIGAHHAPDGWVLLTDMDHVVGQSTLEAIVFGAPQPDTVYGFDRVSHTGERLEPHKNSWLLTKALYWTVGGYDETLSGFYGTDGDWRRRCARVAPMAILDHPLVRYEFVDDASSTRYLRKQPEDAAVQRLVAARGTSWATKTLSFAYHEVRQAVSA